MGILRHVATTGTIVAVGLVAASAAATPTCPRFSEATLPKISSSDRYATFPGGVVARVEQLRIDTDGASTAYHPDGIGSSALCDGMQAYVGGKCLGGHACEEAAGKAQAVNWVREKSPPLCVFGFEVRSDDKRGDSKLLWGGRYGKGPLPLQSADDTAPGFLISKTAVSVYSPMKKKRVYIDADRVPYVVVPGGTAGRSGPTGMLAMARIVRLKDGHAIPAIVADTQDTLGEVSVAAVQMIQSPDVLEPRPVTVDELRGISKPPPYPYEMSRGFVRASINPSDGPYLIIALSTRLGSAGAGQLDIESLRTKGRTAFSDLGGEAFLTDCAKLYFEIHSR